MISLPMYATDGGRAAATIVNSASATTPRGADCHTNPRARAEWAALALRRVARPGRDAVAGAVADAETGG